LTEDLKGIIYWLIFQSSTQIQGLSLISNLSVTALPCREPEISDTAHVNCRALKINKRNALSIRIILELLPELTVYISDRIYSKSNQYFCYETYSDQDGCFSISFLAWKRDFVSQKHLNCLWGPHSLQFNRYQGIFSQE
jgi:hypothetical protein